MSRSRLCHRKFRCLQCGDCCHLFVCGYAMELRGFGASNRGPCEHLRPQADGRMLCGVYLDHLGNGRRARANIMSRHLHFGQGCTGPRNRRRQTLLSRK